MVLYISDTFGQQTPDSRPNTAPAATRSSGAATATTGATAASSTRPSGSSSKPRNGGTSSSPSTAGGASSATSGGPKGGPIQMSALSNILANLGGGAAGQSAAASKPAIDLYDIMTTEVKPIEFL